MSTAFYFLGNLTGTPPIEGSMTSVGSSWSNQSYSQTLGGPPIVVLTLYGFSLCDYNTTVSLSAYSFTFACTQSSDLGPAAMPIKTCQAVVQYSADTTNGSDGTWTTLGTHSLTVSQGGGGGGPTNFTNSFGAVDCKMLRTVVTDVAATVNSPLSAAIQVAAFSSTFITYANMSPLANVGNDIFSAWTLPVLMALSALTLNDSLSVINDCEYANSGCSVTTYGRQPGCQAAYGYPPKVNTIYSDSDPEA